MPFYPAYWEKHVDLSFFFFKLDAEEALMLQEQGDAAKPIEQVNRSLYTLT